MNRKHRVLQERTFGDRVVVVYNWDSLSEYTEPAIHENVVCYDLNGQKLWTINGMDKDPYWGGKPNMFVSLQESGGEVRVTSFAGSSYRLDLQTGEVFFHHFHK